MKTNNEYKKFYDFNIKYNSDLFDRDSEKDYLFSFKKYMNENNCSGWDEEFIKRSNEILKQERDQKLNKLLK